VRLIATDGQGQMDANCLATAIDEDLQNGCVPVLIVATAGTTNAGMIDPLKPCGALAREHGMWFHVDAAWGGAMIASTEGRTALDGIELADSITIDAHKWFATTMGAGMFLTSRPDIPAQVFRISASYMPESEAAKDFYVNSNQWSRRFVGLRLFLALGAAGWDGYGDHVERTIRHAVQRYVDAVHEDGRFWISKAMFEGKPVLRACVTNGRTDEAIIDQLTEFLTTV